MYFHPTCYKFLYLLGQGCIAMLVNVAATSNLCDETLHVLRFEALAEEIKVENIG